MPARMIHYLVAEEVAKQVKVENMNRFKLGSLCPDMSTREDGSKHVTHFMEIHGEVKGCNWITFLSKYQEMVKRDDLYLGIMCHIITDAIWFHDIMETKIRSRAGSKEDRQEMFLRGYADYHRLNYILKKEFSLQYHLEDDKNIEFGGLRMNLYEDVVQGLYKDFWEDPAAEKEELEIYTYDMSLECIGLCIKECVNIIKAFRKGETLPAPERYYVPVR